MPRHTRLSSVRARGPVATLVALCTAVLVASSSVGAAQAADSAVSTVGVVASSSSGSSAGALIDGDVARRSLGSEWSASVGDGAPWVQLTWPDSRQIASVQIFGSTDDAFDPKQSTAAALWGTLRFPDGSSVVVSGIAPGRAMPTTVAFAPRATTSVRLELHRQIPDAPVALRELTAYPVGSTPPRWGAPSSSPSYSAVPVVAACSAATTSSVAPVLPDRLSLACPTPGSSVDRMAKVVLNAPAGSVLTAWASWQGGAVRALPLRRVGSATADASGRALITADVRRLPQGPFALRVTATSSAGRTLAPLYVQLVRSTGTSVAAGAGSSAPKGMTLQYSDDFTGPLSISQSGWGTQYAAVKPEPWGGSQFGEAVFADPAKGAETLATLPEGYLRIRAQSIAGYTAEQTWGQHHISGILSSQRFGGSGFSAQYGYFEARIMGASGPGAWPAFWMLNSESGTGRADGTGGELDAVELYGHDTNGACHTTHSWAPVKLGRLECRQYPLDWAAEWHTYGVRVLPGAAEFFVDGRSVAKLDQLSHTNEPFYFMLDLATGGGWPVDLSATGQTTDMYVDWIRVYT